MAKGGKRPGAGRPVGSLGGHTLEAQEARKILIAKYIAKQDAVDNALIEKAVSGDVPAIREIYDRVFGKAMQAIEMSGKDGKELFTNLDEISKITTLLNEIHRGTSLPSDGGTTGSLDKEVSN